MRLAALVVPNSSPKIQATRSNSAIATRPQLRPPTMSRAAATAFNGFICTYFLEVLYTYCNVAAAALTVKALSKSCKNSVMADDGVLRIGELSKRAGVSPQLLRAWEHRYGLLQPERSSGGLRLYSAADVERVQLMRRHLADGLAAAQAAALALGGEE